MAAIKAKRFRIAVEGATTDGRVISRDWISQMAKNYSPEMYGARINMEHIRGYAADSTFRRFGDVTAVEAEEIGDGPLKGKLALFGWIDPTPELVELTKARQKIYTSIEVNPEFADTGEAYLVGLAVTDDPASLGTEILSFSATAKVNPLTVMIWRLDAGDVPGALEIARYALTHGLVSPDGFKRASLPYLLAEEVASAATRAWTAKAQVDVDPLLATIAMTESEDMPDQVRAKLHKITGYVLRDAGRASEAISGW
jgi:hypothetical protein